MANEVFERACQKQISTFIMNNAFFLVSAATFSFSNQMSKIVSQGKIKNQPLASWQTLICVFIA